ncbi:disintegrin and metalloproteinase domain-containing protein 8 isoform X3 [Bos javanicus]|uniref:disintegrin and metalloproteinase domain-containing protein 8 isoform X3 n=1 Tax=Bos javanicus TaxID=9906 RepID=UPI002AA82F1E|nr:disintegrin and metalloproteinase domain-containing protein 8 isoform X3 [Bos javanicus]
MRGLGLLLFAALGLQGPVPRECELCPRGPRAHLHPAPSEEQVSAHPSAPHLSVPGVARAPRWLFSRDLVGSGYVETYTAANGSQVTEQLQRQDHCFYQGHVEGHPHSAASLSTCAGLRGFFQAGPAVRLIEPLAEAGEEGPHALYLAQHLQQEAGTCGVNDSSLESILGPRVSAAFRPRWSEPRETRYVELFVVTDSKEFQRFGSREAVRQRVLEVVNHVDKLYQELNFRVVLVGLEMWNGGDKIQISSQPDATLDNFLAWRTRELVGRQAHDNVQLITGVDFTGTTVGLAKVSTMCSSSSGAVNQDHNQNPIGVASTMAHEMGHNLGMDHDENVAGCYCPVPREGGGCVMAASIGSQYPRKFSQCSQADLETFVEKPRTACLLDAPDLDRLVGGPVCGNGFLERGEQCDCGRPEDCQNRCCNASTCLLAEGAECAHGTCCHECRVKPAGELCRPAKDQCDLGEHCDGQQPTCPEDAFRENGTPCPGGYCYNGACPTLARRCQDLWGPGSRVAVETCFLYSISKGCGAGVPLPFGRVNKCGTLFCEGGQKTPERGYCTLTISSGVCRVIVQDGSTEYELVPKGTKCGEQQVCWDGFCQGLHVYRSRNCSAQCNSHGECNHKGQCHCRPGWAPPHCAEPLADARAAPGSLRTHVLVGVGALVVLALILAGVLIYRKARSPVRRRNVAPKTAMGLSNPLFHEGLSKPAKGGAQAPPGGSPELALYSQPHKPTASSVTPKRPPPAVSASHPDRLQATPRSQPPGSLQPPAAKASPPSPLPVYPPQAPGQQLRPAPPAKPLPVLKPKQVIKPTCAPPMPPIKPGARGAQPGPTQGAADPKVALKPPVQRR